MFRSSVYSCCVPGCLTISNNLANFVPFPYELERRNSWIKIIGRKNWVINHTSLVCTAHFDQDEVGHSGEGKRTVSYANVNSLPKYIPPLKEFDRDLSEMNIGACPEMFKIKERDSLPDIFFDILIDLDIIPSFPFLAENVRKTLKNHFTRWKIYTSSDAVVLIMLDVENIPNITATVKISIELLVRIYLGGIELDPADTTWILPIDRRLNRWSQLDHILNVYGA